jgi:hypothetical protein
MVPRHLAVKLLARTDVNVSSFGAGRLSSEKYKIANANQGGVSASLATMRAIGEVSTEPTYQSATPFQFVEMERTGQRKSLDLRPKIRQRIIQHQ